MSATHVVHATDGTLLFDLGPYLTVEHLLEHDADLNDYILPEPYAAGYRVDPNYVPGEDALQAEQGKADLDYESDLRI